MFECRCLPMSACRNLGLPRALLYGFNALWCLLVVASVGLGSALHQGYYFISIGCVVLIVATCGAYNIYRTCSEHQQAIDALAAAAPDVICCGPPPSYEEAVIGQTDEPPDYAEVMRMQCLTKQRQQASAAESQHLLPCDLNSFGVRDEK
ncbi:uncharacterized protein LOC125756868 isoform X2 [Rhipicephalus sanguineus]|uniref:uncharacterized protein LOC125756868 isoform X2 n=1 Tax=Rhipicephalus sanguineus TaxID=34632 RepID=UPI0020C37F91|nr:uncharacterized protein LOC125756868 isoform X2 [Rhipicephalus sanguineus]